MTGWRCGGQSLHPAEGDRRGNSPPHGPQRLAIAALDDEGSDDPHDQRRFEALAETDDERGQHERSLDSAGIGSPHHPHLDQRRQLPGHVERVVAIDEYAGLSCADHRYARPDRDPLTGEKGVGRSGCPDRRDLTSHPTGTVSRVSIAARSAAGGIHRRDRAAERIALGIAEKHWEPFCRIVGGDVLEVASLVVGLGGTEAEMVGEERRPQAPGAQHPAGNRPTCSGGSAPW